MSPLSRTILGLGVSGLLGMVGLSAAQSSATPDRSLLDQYCVSCHNEKLKTAGLMLDKIDLSQVASHAAVLEKVALKLRSGQMPPAARPHPHKPTVDAF